MNYFDPSEYECKCGRADCFSPSISPALLQIMNRVRHGMGRPMKINSGLRCKNHNFKVGGSPTSSHLTGYAVDIHVPDDEYRAYLVTYMKEQGVNRMGFYRNFVHVDVDPTKPAYRFWWKD